MSVLKPFAAYRPPKELCAKVAAPPYDVLNSAEAREFVAGNPYSFLHVDKAEIDLPEGIEPKSAPVYERARDNLKKMIADGVYVQDASDCFYIYVLERKGHIQRGLVGLASIDEYLSGKIKIHEHTLADQEQDRIDHMDYCSAHTGPIFLAYRGEAEINALLDDFCAKNEPVYDFVSEDKVRNTIYAIDDANINKKISALFADKVDALYIADGHHRTASAVKTGLKRRAKNPGFTGGEDFNFFLCVAFPKEELKILDYNRVVADLGEYTSESFLEALSKDFEISPEKGAFHPEKRGEFAFYTEKKWYRLNAKNIDSISDVVEALDVSVLQERVLDGLLGIKDPRNDSRVAFIGGARGLGELERLVDSGQMKAAFALFPTDINELFAVADAGRNMPPKSTWFEPKLKSGIFVHTF
ncbi:MAG: DUF1015 domain-containing protein [Firmicutes bacterium]|nr:DUF1015 domain-containing protein [Bacillota bacterium]